MVVDINPLNMDNVGRTVFTVVCDTTNNTIGETSVELNGVVTCIYGTLTDTDGSDTYTITVEDEDNINYWSKATVADNGTTVWNLRNSGTANSNESFPVAGKVTVSIVISGNQAAESTQTIVVLYERA